MRISIRTIRHIVNEEMSRLQEARWRELMPHETTSKIAADELKIGDWIVFRGWGTDVKPWLKQVRSIGDPGYALLIGLNTERGFERMEFPYDRDVEIIERNDT